MRSATCIYTRNDTLQRVPLFHAGLHNSVAAPLLSFQLDCKFLDHLVGLPPDCFALLPLQALPIVLLDPRLQSRTELPHDFDELHVLLLGASDRLEQNEVVGDQLVGFLLNSTL